MFNKNEQKSQPDDIPDDIPIADSSSSSLSSSSSSISPSPSPYNASSPFKKKNIIICWDFDWSLVNQNSDYYAQEKLYGAEEYTLKMFPKLREEAAKVGTVVFTDFMDKVGWPKIFNEFKLNDKKFSDLVCDIPVFQENLQILHTINKHSLDNNNGKSSFNINQYIISNANSVLIDIILNKNKLNGNVFKWDNIFTNPGWYDEKTGILRCSRYHNVNDKLNAHDCDICAKNLCKGKVLREEVLTRHNRSYCYDNIVIYIGDGGNDFCPVRLLNKSDFVFARQFPECKGLEAKIKKDGAELKCNVLKWKNGKELLENFQKVLPDLGF